MRGLARLLRPKSIAIIGGRDEARYVTENCAKVGFAGPVWHVHPNRGGYARLEDLPQAPDVAFVCVNRHATVDVIAKLRGLGTGGAVAYAAGFQEAEAELGDGPELERKLLAAAGDMPMLGPNCYGFINYLDGAALWPDQQGGSGPSAALRS
jgi:acyl-CoA synthetase (NDP forming)